jgi:hypothetical protein
MKQKTFAEIAAENGLTSNQLEAAKKTGIDPRDPKQLAAWIAKKRHRVQPGAKMLLPEATATAQSLEEMELAIRQAQDIDTVKILKEKVLALKGIVAVQMETRELVPVGEVRQSITRVVSAARGELLKFAADIPPRAEGLEASAIQKLIQAEVIEILTRLSDETNAIYAEESSH